jgi:hypothetical protein|tara:strand:- start:551 stop:838 length:288 start_codon:yes stop_codon:yes gene_type:complete
VKLKVKDNCPLDNFNPCRKFECGWFIQIRGKHPQTGEEVDEYGCAMALMPMLMIENSRQTSQAGSAIESFRNEMVKQNMTTLSTLMKGMDKKKLK